MVIRLLLVLLLVVMLLLVVVMVASVARAESEELGAEEWSHLDQATLLLSTPGDTAGQQWLAAYFRLMIKMSPLQRPRTSTTTPSTTCRT